MTFISTVTKLKSSIRAQNLEINIRFTSKNFKNFTYFWKPSHFKITIRNYSNWLILNVDPNFFCSILLCFSYLFSRLEMSSTNQLFDFFSRNRISSIEIIPSANDVHWKESQKSPTQSQVLLMHNFSSNCDMCD